MLRDMEYVYAVYQELSFSKAAQRLFITQPALSNKIKKIELQIRMPLFDRSTTPISLTAAGRAYINAAEKIMAIEKDLELQLAELSINHSGSISVGGAAFFCAHVLPELSSLFQERYPNCTVNILEGNTGDLTQCLQTGVVDFILDVDPMDSNTFIGQPMGEEHILLAVPAQIAINEQLKSYRLTFEEVRDGRFYDENCPKTDLGCFKHQDFLLLKKGNDMHQRASKMCRNAGFSPNVKMYLDQMLTSYYVASNGFGVTFIRNAITHYVEPTDKLFFYKIDDPNVVRGITLYYKKDTHLSPAARDFARFMQQIK
ncbi:LysR family transcriptional regulator [Oscillospiraceae bacterium LTW-04]|nr:LysR family transcriptional regulator [Oscillospiraceae bacterium MB24-C1]